ncbi:MAG: universal stress protein [Desulfosarcinaceae bacterium]
MWKMLSLLQKNLVWSIPLSMIAGLFYGYRFDTAPLKQFIIPVTFVMVYPMMATLNVESIFKGRDLKLQATTQAVNFILIPLIAYLVGKLFFSSGMEKHSLWAVGIFLIGVLPTSGMTISWTGFAKGNKEAAIKMVVFGLVLGALAAPVYTKVFMGATIDVNMLHMFKQIALFVFVPLALGLATQYLAIRRYGRPVWNRHIKPKFPPFSALGVAMIAFLAMALKARHIIANPSDIVTILVPLAVFYLVTYLLLSLIGRFFFQRGDAIAMVFGVVMRDLSIALAIAMTAFGRQGLTIALLISLAYVIQIQSAAWYVRLAEIVFGKAEAGAESETPVGIRADKDAAAADPASLQPPPTDSLPRIRRILLATDLSPTARYAALHACGLGDQFHAEVTVMHVIPDLVDLPAGEAGTNLAEFMPQGVWQAYHQEELEKACRQMDARIRKTAGDFAKKMPPCSLTENEIRVGLGNPATEIVKAARRGAYDLIIMGSQGNRKPEQAMIGSVAHEVIRQSEIPVLVVRLPSKHEARVWERSSSPTQAAPLTY